MARRPSRPRGESDLGRPNTLYNGRPRAMTTGMMLKRTVSSVGTPKTSPVSQILSGLLMPLPWLLGALSYNYNFLSKTKQFSAEAKLIGLENSGRHFDALLHASAICAGALLTVAVLKTAQMEMAPQGKQWTQKGQSQQQSPPFSVGAKRVGKTITGLVLPMFVSIQLGAGISTALLLVIAQSCSLGYGANIDNMSIWLSHKGKLAALAFILIADYLLGYSYHPGASFWMYGLLLFSLFWPRNPLLEAHSPIWIGNDLSHTTYSAAALAVMTLLGSIFSSFRFTWFGSLLFFMAFASTACAIFYIEPRHYLNRSYLAAATSTAIIFLWSSISASSAVSLLSFAAICAVCLFGVWYDSGEMLQFGQNREKKQHKHNHNGKNYSQFSAYLIEMTTPGSILHSILIERDSRRIAYFGCLNLSFMMVQFFYGFVTGSLGLLTDSIHMLFDCLGLAVGLAAAVMSKWPPTIDFPYGYAKIDTLSGFANGIFLILVSVEIVFDALHRLREGYELRRLNELLIVSILGFLVNIIGLTAFGHAHHHGHSHGHDHGHSHPHHGHSHSQNHEHSHTHNHTHAQNHEHESTYQHSHKEFDHKNHGHQHKKSNSSTPAFPNLSTPPSPTASKIQKEHVHNNENMQGIFLHILADALGSVAVIISTILTKLNSWNGWDPLASCIIAVLIFFSAIPLVKSSGSRLLLSLSDEAEYSCRGVLQGLSELRGVIGYGGVRLWMADQEAPAHHDHHDHHHVHDEKCEHSTKPTVLGVIHIVAALNADLDDVRDRVEQYFKSRGMDIVVHVEKEGDGRCWCGSGLRAMASPTRSTFGSF